MQGSNLIMVVAKVVQKSWQIRSHFQDAVTVLHDLPVRLGELESFSHKSVAVMLYWITWSRELTKILQNMLGSGQCSSYL